MRYLFLLILLAGTHFGWAQKEVQRAIVKSVTEITFPENPNRNPGGEDDARPFGGGMESTNTVYFRGDFIKTFNQTDFGNNTVIIDKKNNKTITIIEAMGQKTGYYSTPQDEELMRKRMDSLRQAGGFNRQGQAERRQGEPEIVATDETRKIAGYNCKKTVIKTKTNNGEVNETIVWYTPDLKMPADYPQAGAVAPGGGRGFSASFGGGARGGAMGVQGLDKINGFVMAYEMSRANGFSMKMEVKKIEIDPEIKDKVFEVPKGTELKPISEMQNMFGPGGPGRGRQVIVVEN